MKRVGNIYEKIISVENLKLADTMARRGKRNTRSVLWHNKNRDSNIMALHEVLKNNEFKTSPYHIFKVYKPKEREIYSVPYYPDRIVHWAIMLQLEPIWTKIFTRDTYSCIKGRGMHGVARKLAKDIKHDDTNYCLKLDIRKFYPSIDQDILMVLIQKKIKCKQTLNLLSEIIHSIPRGLPIGNYISQFAANLYLAYFDHWAKEQLRAKYYYRYCDDIVILSESKEELHQWFLRIKDYMKQTLQLTIKCNYQIFPISRGIDFVGYVFFKNHIRLRKSIKKSMMQKYSRLIHNEVSGLEFKKGMASFWGWINQPFSNTKHLCNILMTRFSDLNIKPPIGTFGGKKVPIDSILNVEISILDYRIEESKFQDRNPLRLQLSFLKEDNQYITFSGSKILMEMIRQIPKELFPIDSTIIKDDKKYILT
jgi:retron-type reverse transcriptase